MNKSMIGAAVPLFRFAFMFTDIPDEQAAYLYHRNRTSPHDDGGPFSLPATVLSRSGCDWTEVSLHTDRCRRAVCVHWTLLCLRRWRFSLLFRYAEINHPSCVRKNHGAPAARLPACRCSRYVSGLSFIQISKFSEG